MNDNSIKRPTGITILAWLYLISSGFWLLLGPYMAIYIYKELYLMPVIITTIISIFTFTISHGLFKGQKWSWFLGVFPLVFIIFDYFISKSLRTLFQLLKAIEWSILNKQPEPYIFGYLLSYALIIIIVYILLTSLFSSRVIEYFSFTALSKVNDFQLFLYLLLAQFVIELIIKLFFLILS